MDDNYGTAFAGVEMKVVSIRESSETRKERDKDVVEIRKFMTKIEPFRDDLAVTMFVKEAATCSFTIGDIFVLKKIESQTKLDGKGKKSKKLEEDKDTE